MEPLRHPPIGFAHRGARAVAPDNTLESFRLALDMGATGLESDVWLSADGVPVLDHDGRVRRRWLWRQGIDRVARQALPAHVPTLEELYAECGTGFELSLDVMDPAAVPAVLAVARAAGEGAIGRLWLCTAWEQAREWRRLDADVRLVDSTRITRMREGPERRAASLQDAGVDAVNLHHSDWTAGLTTLFHRFERYAFAWDAQFPRVLVGVLAMGCDAVYSDHVDRMMAALAEFTR